MIYLKDPDADLDYTFDWAVEYLQSGETIQSSTWVAEPPGITVGDTSHTDTTTTVKLSGGVHGVLYRIVNHITTNINARGDDRALYVRAWEPI